MFTIKQKAEALSHDRKLSTWRRAKMAYIHKGAVKASYFDKLFILSKVNGSHKK